MFTISVVGGTFDRFHKGHRYLLDEVLSRSEKVIIGLATNRLYNKKRFFSAIQAYETREKSLRDYINDKKASEKIKIVPIDDIFGPTLELKNIDAIFVTEENIDVANIINRKRLVKGFPKLEVISVALLAAEDDQIISSERIRKGEIDREGNVYSLYFKNKILSLPEQMRADLREPIGTITKDLHGLSFERGKIPLVISVGDIVSLFLAETGVAADISIIDFKTRRQGLENRKEEILKYFPTADFSCANRAGLIEPEAASVVKKSIDHFLTSQTKRIIHISGEEDLLTLPAVLFAPLDALVIYGQYDQGAVIVKVTEQKKKEVFELVKRFNS